MANKPSVLLNVYMPSSVYVYDPSLAKAAKSLFILKTSLLSITRPVTSFVLFEGVWILYCYLAFMGQSTKF